MNTSKLLAGTLLALSFSTATVAVAALPGASVQAILSAAATGQMPEPSVKAPPRPVVRTTVADRREVEKLLSRARQAMKDGNLETADSLVARAEAMNVEYTLFHLGDTPKKARHDLDQRRKTSRTSAKRPSERFRPENQENTANASAAAPGGAVVSEPSLDRTTTPMLTPPGEDASGLPGLDRKDDLTNSPFKRQALGGPPSDLSNEADLLDPTAKPIAAATEAAPDLRRQSDALLLGARRALAQGDLRRATAQIEEAKKLNFNYGFHDDSPAKVEAMIRKTKEITELRGSRPDAEAARHQYADLLMEQAEQLMRWKEYDEAERLAMDAGRIKANYGPFDAKPDNLLGKINIERRRGGAVGKPNLGAQAAGAGAAQPSRPALGKSGRDQYLLLLTQARAALAAGEIDAAEQLAGQADALRLPEAAFGPQDDRTWRVLSEVRGARSRQTGVVRAADAAPANDGGAPARYPTTQAVYDPNNDATRNLTTSARSLQSSADDVSPAEPLNRLPPPADAQPTGEPSVSPALRLFREGEQALRDHDVIKARERFRQAYALREQLDAVTAQRLQDHLQLSAGPKSAAQPTAPPKTLMDDATARQQLLVKQMSAEVQRQQLAARKLQATDAQRAGEVLLQTRVAIEGSELEATARAQLLKRLDMSLAEVAKYVKEHRAEIELDKQNKDVRSEVENRRLYKLEIDDRLAKMADDFNHLLDERRFGEAEVIAKRAMEIAPDNPFSRQLLITVKMAYRNFKNQQTIDKKEEGVWSALDSVEDALIPFDDRNPIVFGDIKKWKELTDRRRRHADGNSRRSKRELDIEQKLSTPVSLNFRNKPLGEVLHELAKLADINLYLDPQGLQEEGWSSDTPVTIDLSQAIALKSALHLILEPLHLSYVIKDEVLKITSEQLKDGQIFPVIYSVADLVIPIPNFVPNNRIGLQGALLDAQQSMYGGSIPGFGTPTPTAMLASRDGAPGSGVINPAVLAQMDRANPSGGGTRSASTGGGPPSYGPGGMSGGQQADFDSLIDLITTTIAPTTWDEVGGPGSIAEFKTNLSLVISQTQEIHEQIADLLSQLRRLQDLQVTIEVRFITLNDNFFEQIGVDFNMNIENLDNNQINVNGHPTSPGAVVGLDPPAGNPPNFTSSLDIPFSQSSFTLATPQFGQPTDVSHFGFAILSDIEAYFLVNASQGDRRSNVLQAPKVTLFNGQQAFVSDTSQTPFVISVIPVVGDFAAAQQPVIVVLSEGTFMTVQAVISQDRRFVRLTIVPFFSQIGNVQEFTFQGSNSSSTSTSGSNATSGAGSDGASGSSANSVSNNGITVQLPTFSFVTVTTTVSVPDGGTVLLGGVKRLSEGRNEFGVPILSKLPYINRLFKNVGIGRETQSLMMMVTPRIIIQEEEEERLGIQPPAPAAP